MAEIRHRWFRIPGPPAARRHQLDFRVGGGEFASGELAPVGVLERIEYESRFVDICPDRRIVLTYELRLNGDRRWTSLVVVELDGAASTKLTHTEHYALLMYTGDGAHDVAHLAGGTRLQLNGLPAALAPVSA